MVSLGVGVVCIESWEFDLAASATAPDRETKGFVRGDAVIRRALRLKDRSPRDEARTLREPEPEPPFRVPFLCSAVSMHTLQWKFSTHQLRQHIVIQVRGAHIGLPSDDERRSEHEPNVSLLTFKISPVSGQTLLPAARGDMNPRIN